MWGRWVLEPNAAVMRSSAGLFSRNPWAMHHFITAEIRWFTRREVCGFSCHIGVRQAMTFAVVIRSTRLFPNLHSATTASFFPAMTDTLGISVMLLSSAKGCWQSLEFPRRARRYEGSPHRHNPFIECPRYHHRSAASQLIHIYPI